jgi:hypothetical protein
MFGDTLTVTLGGSGGTAKVCNKINQDSYGAEYLLNEGTGEIRVKIRHLKEALKEGELYPIERHQVEFTQTIFATGSTPQYTRDFYMIMRNYPNDTVASVSDVGEALSYFLGQTNILKVLGWEV